MNVKCIYCNFIGEISSFELDHIIPLSRGGSDFPQNKRLICSGCNREKAEKTHEEYVLWRIFTAMAGIKVNYGPITGGGF